MELLLQESSREERRDSVEFTSLPMCTVSPFRLLLLYNQFRFIYGYEYEYEYEYLIFPTLEYFTLEHFFLLFVLNLYTLITRDLVWARVSQPLY